jgi:hypothetical protein
VTRSPAWQFRAGVSLALSAPTAREIAELQATTADEAIKRASHEFGIDGPAQADERAAYRVA